MEQEAPRDAWVVKGTDTIQAERIYHLQLENNKFRTALLSISKNSCCDTCQEAKFVALGALGET